ALTSSGSRDELKLRRGSLPAVTHSCGSFSLRRATAAALRSVSDNRFGAGAGGAGECEACFAFGFDRGGGICPGVTTPAGSPLRSMRTAGLERFAVGNIVGPAYLALRHDTGEHDGQILVDADLERLAWLRVAHETFWKPLAQKFERAFDCAHRRESPSRECADATPASLSRESRGRATQILKGALDRLERRYAEIRAARNFCEKPICR